LTNRAIAPSLDRSIFNRSIFNQPLAMENPRDAFDSLACLP
jgi:hypothetical protein